MGVTEITSRQEFQKAVDSNSLVVLDCYATWCPPCKAVAPKFQEFSEKYTNASFYKVNVDEVPDVVQELGVRSMPTFYYFKNGEPVHQVSGAVPPAIESGITSNL